MCSDWTEEDKVHLGEELSDVLIYLVRLAERCHVDLPSAVVRKLQQNAEKYPACTVHGKNSVGSDYKDTSTTNDSHEVIVSCDHKG